MGRVFRREGVLHWEELGCCEHQRGAVSFRAPGGSKTCFCNERQPHAGTHFHETKTLKKEVSMLNLASQDMRSQGATAIIHSRAQGSTCASGC